MKLPIAFKKALPVALPAFVFRAGSVGMDLVPLVIVALAFPAHQAAIIMALVRTAAIIGNIIGGWITDIIGIKRTLQIGFWISAISMCALPFQKVWWLLGITAFFAQMGNEVLKSPNRMLIFATLPKSEQTQGVAWFRSANNFGFIIAFVVSFIAADLGFVALMLFDSLTSIVASIVSLWILKDIKEPKKPTERLSIKDFHLGFGFFLVCGVGAIYAFCYRMLMTSASARAKLVFGDNSIQVFSVFMIINAFLCATLAIWAAKRFQDPRKASATGIGLTLIGMLIMVYTTDPISFWIASFLSTIGEVIIMALMVIWVYAHTPESPRQSLHMGLGLTIQHIGGLIGASLAFPVLVYAQQPKFNMWIIVALVIGSTSLAIRQVAKYPTLR